MQPTHGRVTAGLLALAIALSLGPAACTRRKPPPPPEEESETESTLPPKVDQAFLTQTMGPGVSLANQPLLAEMDRRPGTEALIATHRGRRQFEVAVVRGNARVLARAPLGGKILAHALVQAVGEFRAMDLFGDGQNVYLMPVETLVYKQPVCGFLAFKYRYEALSLIGEFGGKCWRKEAGGPGTDPFAWLHVKREGATLRIETDEVQGTRTYRWDAEQQAFLSLAPAK